MAGPTRYTLVHYGEMVTCEPRMSAYAKALRQAVTSGCTVMDIGAGPGAFSLLACQFGAGSVIAIEPDDSIELLDQLAVDNGCVDRITRFQGLSTDFQPDSKADIIVSDIRGCLPLFESHVETIVDARTRLLAPNGKLIPARDTLRMAIVESAEDYAMVEEPWARNDFGLDLGSGRRFAANSWWKVKLEAEALLTKAVDLAVLDYYQIEEADLSSTVELTVSKGGKAHGLAIWFDTELVSGIGFSNAPGEPPLIYGQAFLPLERAVDVNPGDQARVEFKASLIDGSYVWGWNACLFRDGSAEPVASFRQSTFLSRAISPQSLSVRAGNFVPGPSEAHAIDRLCLSLIDGNRTLSDIACRLHAEFPSRFINAAQALNYIANLTTRYQ